MFIHLKNVSFTYNLHMPFEKEALRFINIKINEGEFIGIIGHTGCGKTTLLQLFNGLLEPTDGEVLFNGININKDKNTLREIRKKIGLTFQYPENQLFEETIFKEVAFGPKNMGIENHLLEQKVMKALEMVKMDYHHYKDISPFCLSGGEMRRVAIASILSLEPEIIILDEPTASLDPLNRRELLKIIKELHHTFHKTIILVSHNMEVVAELAERLLVMEKGEIIMDDKPRTIFEEYARTLENIGLALPSVTSIMHQLRQMGRPVNSGVLTINEAKKEILKLAKRIK